MNIKTVEGLPNSFDSDEQGIHIGPTEKDTLSMKRFKKANDLMKSKDLALRPLYLNHREKPASAMENNSIILEYEGNEYNIQDTHSLDLSVSEAEDFIQPMDPTTISFLNDQPSTSNAANNIAKFAEQNKDDFDTGTEPKTKKPKQKKTWNKIVTETHRPRRSGIQILSSSHIAKKYDELLDRRKILLDKQIEIANQDLAIQKAKQKLELELLTLKVSREKK